MSEADVHQILIPYLYAGGAMALIVGIAAVFLKRDGDKEKAKEEPTQTQARVRRGRSVISP
jgi:hypothetical protein